MISLLLSILSLLSPISSPTTAGEDITNDSTAVNEAEKLREEFRLQMEKKNRVGTKAADFKFETREGEDTSLHAISSERDIILIFYNPDCDNCHAAIDSISALNKDGRFQVVAIDSEEDRDEWNQTASGLPDGWTVGFATDPIQEDETYYIFNMPTIYLLDKDKTVLLKDTTVEKIFTTAGK
ncbi:MAG: thioredoxin family protein [Muribaculaceae bacterium]|nr:thioredoxin family protein [Muribaculaceae bacterium]